MEEDIEPEECMVITHYSHTEAFRKVDFDKLNEGNPGLVFIPAEFDTGFDKPRIKVMVGWKAICAKCGKNITKNYQGGVIMDNKNSLGHDSERVVFKCYDCESYESYDKEYAAGRLAEFNTVIQQARQVMGK
jgi:hypothetical protein